MPRAAKEEYSDDESDDGSIDERDLIEATLPEPEPVQIKVSTLHREYWVIPLSLIQVALSNMRRVRTDDLKDDTDVVSSISILTTKETSFGRPFDNQVSSIPSSTTSISRLSFSNVEER